MNDALLGGYQQVRFLLCGGGDVTVTIYLCVSRAVAYYGSRSLGCQKVSIKFYRSQPENANEIMRSRCIFQMDDYLKKIQMEDNQSILYFFFQIILLLLCLSVGIRKHAFDN